MDPAQTYLERLPARGLAGSVRTVWIQTTGTQPYLQRNVPTGGVELHCRLGAMPQLLGPLTGPYPVLLPPRTTMIGVRFRPGAAAALLDCPADALLDTMVDLDAVWGVHGAELGAAFAAAPDADAALELLQRRLIARYRRAERPDPLVAEATRRLMPWQPIGIDDLSTSLAISRSQLRRRVTAAAGTSPKVLQRILRFQGFLALAQAGAGSTSATDLAVAAGYADQAHLGRECVRLAGVTPRELLGGARDRCGCGHDHSASFRPFLSGRARVPVG